MSVQTATEANTHRGVNPIEDIELQPTTQVPQQQQQTVAVDEESGLTRKNLLKILAAGFSFFFAGTNDGSLGPLTPYILKTYHIGTAYVAIMYGTNVDTYLRLLHSHKAPVTQLHS